MARVGHPERDRAAVALRRHYLAGRISADELSERLELALAARSRHELRRALATLPQPWLQLDEVVLPALRATGERVRHAALVAAMFFLWLSLSTMLLILFVVAAAHDPGVLDLVGFPVAWLVVTALLYRAAVVSRRRTRKL